MSLVSTKRQITQIPMPGMPVRTTVHSAISCCNIVQGQGVLYLGRVGGGPRYGSRGSVKRTLRRVAIVDMGSSGTWHIPYYFLAIPEAA